MGTYVNPGKRNYQVSVNSPIFVDKTEMIHYLNTVVDTQQRFVSVSRPRRFGKTMAADMLCAYYDRQADSRAMFEKRKLAKCPPAQIEDKVIHWNEYLGRFDVIRLVMTDFMKKDKSVTENLNVMTGRILRELSELYPSVQYDETDLPYSMDRFYRASGTPFVIVIDEWDAIFRLKKEDKRSQTEYLNFLRDWMKDRPYIALAYMTGILPIKKYGEHSALNMFDEYSMIQPMRMAEYTGFTKKEVLELCALYQMEYEDISAWYDGYRLTDFIPVNKRTAFRLGEYQEHRMSVYSPLSVVCAMRNGVVDNYWNKTENYEALADYIRLDYDGLKDTIALLMDGARIQVNLKGYQNDMTSFRNKNDILALLIHLGYLGFEADESQGRIDSEQGEVFIPNREILEEFKTSTESGEWTGTFEQFHRSQELVQATWNEDADKVAELLENAHNRASNKTYNDESALSYAVQYAYYAAQKYYTTILELDSGKGFVDIAYLPAPSYSQKPVLLIELKVGKSTGLAIGQIMRQKYLDRFEHSIGNILMIGINYDKAARPESPNFKHHTCTIERA